ncbi:hypothetical protein KAFR_0D01200 [Kazachstania africana CBS 2517]|uniref:Glutathione synthetase n=1 Tax=Kazachstania africana (strain ATCC 22294 / BCRC 22015 / CBS 2517 / CECT 1963 / NBRC 1671 / NRRL Y-8276) TaxID=1071382 RepID=H2ATR6_KAZAF|nr:hypothetical protein KAFR_0D01200 [Kazachstania africana CBS 2517]CCF57766.1 hypothetical protein KAFR_0D01200 [Kazachstania africana CBS 2517]
MNMQSMWEDSKIAEHPPFPNVSESKIKENVLPQLNQWALVNGLVMQPTGSKSNDSRVAPVTLYPTPIPRTLYNEAKDLQKHYNKLYASIARNDGNWLSNEISKINDANFTKKLYEMYKRVESKQAIKLGVFRSDYLVTKDSKEIKQVEFNTISVSFGGLSTKAGEMHNFLNQVGSYMDDSDSFYDVRELPNSESSVFLTRGIANALAVYQPDPANSKKKENTLVAFIVEPNEVNIFDQKLIEFNLLRLYGIQCIRLTFDEVATKLEYSKDGNKRLILKGSGKEIGLVYYRTGYTETDYHNESHWKAREFLEASYAIKAPDLSIQLSGAKKVQQLLTDDKILSKFVDDASIRKSLRKTFVKIYPLDESELGKQGRKLAMETPEKFVLKPQREGGNHNIYKSDIPKYLSEIKKEDWNDYILMELIDAKENTENYIVRDNELIKEPIISELGIYGCILFDNQNIHSNEFSGSLLRSKIVSSNEGGVMAGHAALDSMCLV